MDYNKNRLGLLKHDYTKLKTRERKAFYYIDCPSRIKRKCLQRPVDWDITSGGKTCLGLGCLQLGHIFLCNCTSLRFFATSKGMKSIPINEPWIQMFTENSLQTESHVNSSHIL